METLIRVFLTFKIIENFVEHLTHLVKTYSRFMVNWVMRMAILFKETSINYPMT